MITKNKALIGLMAITSACICSFAFMQNEDANFAKAEDVIHTVTIGYGYNHLPEASGNTTLVNEEGTEINCKASVGSHLSFRYNASYCSIDNSKLDDSSYNIIFFINGIVSFDLNESYGDYDGLVGAIYRNDKIYKSRTFSNVHLKDDEGLCTKAELNIPIRPVGYEYTSIVIKYSESKCRELSK